ncbi:MAG: ribonuclease HII [Candidatus Binatia bacterium]
MAGGEQGRPRRRRGATEATTHLEALLWQLGIRAVAGVDEVGMGPLAGPVVAAAVVLEPGSAIPGAADSKTLTAVARERLAQEIRSRACAVGVGAVEPEEIDRINVYQAGFEAMRRALAALAPLEPGFVLVDGREIPALGIPQSAYPKGDTFVCSIAAASIVAKVHRDAIMRALDGEFPAYGFARHMGYPTPDHLAVLREAGPCRVHRRSFAPVREAAGLGQLGLPTLRGAGAVRRAFP